MKKNYIKHKLALFSLAFMALSQGVVGQITQTYSYTGGVQSFTVPSCVSQLTVDLRGAQGANALDKLTTNSVGGPGGRVLGVLTVTPGQVLNIYVGGAGSTAGTGGYNGGGAGGLSTAGGGCNGGYAGGGGGATDIRIGGTALANRVVVAGGGGGSGRDYCNGSCVPCGCGGSGGAGGGTTGSPGQAANNCGFSYPGGGINFGAGGGQSAGGTGGPGDSSGPSGTAGVLGVGGDGGSGSYDVSGGGGGGGYYGGGGGGSASSGSGVGGGGGGGGSSWMVNLTNAVTTPSFQTGNGQLILSYVVNGGIVNAAANNTLICTGASINLTTSGTVLSYTWSTGSNNASLTVSPTTNTVYTVSATNSIGCISNASVGITVNTQPTLSVLTSTNVTCLGKTVTVTASGANTYTWSNNVTNGGSFAPTSTGSYTVTGTNACGTASAITSITVAPLPVSVISSTTQVCAGTGATLTAAAAATGFTWAPVAFNGASLTVSPLVNTVYSVAVSDGTCSGNGTVALNVVSVPTVAAVASSTNLCSGLSVTLTASGTSGVTYSWTTINQSGAVVVVTPNAPTAYPVTATNANGCSASTNVVIITNPSPTVNLTVSNNFVCANTPITMGVTGATSYLWSDGSTSNSLAIAPATSTVYTVTGTALGCTSTQTAAITVFIPTLSVTGPTAICNGATATITASGADTYTWSGNPQSAVLYANPAATTIYTVDCDASSGNLTCPGSATFQLVVNQNPTVTAVASRTAMCKNESVSISASGASTYSWSNASTTASIVVNPSLVTTVSYTVTGTNASGCTNSAVVQIKVNGCTGINELNGLASALQIYPNPSNGDFTIQFDSEIKLSLVNELGQVIKTVQLNNANDYKVHVTGLASGIYFITGQKNNQKIESKIVVTK